MDLVFIYWSDRLSLEMFVEVRSIANINVAKNCNNTVS